jgi:PAS domain S-box-containing protein
LIVEDSEDDTALLLQELRRGGYNLSFERVDTPVAMSAALAKQTWDIVIADHAMPHFNAPAALQLLQNSGLNLPFIIVSGKIGEDLALATMKVGAHDYIMKDNLARLDPAIKRELRQAVERQRHQQVEETLRESEEHYRNLFENANDAIATLTLEGTITDVNRGLEIMLGWSREELIGQHYRKLATPASLALAEERTRKALAGEKLPSIFELEFMRKDGSVVPIEARARFIRNQEGKPTGVQGICRDISAKKELERQQVDFLAMLIHDIKNPLSVILGYAGALRQVGELSSEQEGMVRRLEINTQAALLLVNNYLDFSKVGARRLTLIKQPLGLNDLLRRVVRQYEAEAQRQNIALEFHLQQELPAVEADALALERVFANLVHNALKFTPKLGQVMISSGQQNGEVAAAVADTGPGIAPEEVPAIFEKYRRAATGRHREGTGLGLFIAKALVEAHGGRIEVESTVGRGSCFSVFLPTSPANQAET